MSRAVLPRMSRSQKSLLAGRCEEMPTDTDRLPPLSADDDPQYAGSSWAADHDDGDAGGGGAAGGGD